MSITFPMKKIFLAVFFALFLFGCTASQQQGSLQGIDVEKIKQLVNDPDVEITSENFSAEQMAQKLSELNPQCANKLSAKPYTVVYAVSQKVDLTVFVGVEAGVVDCIIRKEKQLDECVTGADCNDGLSSTVDKCDGVPRVCSNERIKECIAGDQYCPKECTKETDSDCTRECVVDADCDDANVSTKDSCSGIVKVCLNLPILIGGKILRSCESDTDCDDANACTLDTCGAEKTCTFSNETNGMVCGLKSECFDGACVDNALNKIKIISPQIRALSENSVEITWKTNKLGKSEVKYDVDNFYRKSKAKAEDTIEHSIVLDNLNYSSEYFYKILSADHADLGIAEYVPFSSFFTCPKCDDGNKCTKDLCDITLGACSNETDTSVAGC
ncbi:MAG: hypothetical protein HYW50_00950 [Candidatus Diapherotrites archaeon]|nr:hypothetical protein [Candidatus Diapherotrites archaeon]